MLLKEKNDYTEDYITEHLTEKGELESNEEYQNRYNRIYSEAESSFVSKRNREEEKKTLTIQKKLATNIVGWMIGIKLKKLENLFDDYDQNNQEFCIDYYNQNLILPVPMSESQSFKSFFSSNLLPSDVSVIEFTAEGDNYRVLCAIKFNNKPYTFTVDL